MPHISVLSSRSKDAPEWHNLNNPALGAAQCMEDANRRTDDIPRRGFLSIAPCPTTDKDAPEGHNLNNTVQAEGAVRCSTPPLPQRPEGTRPQKDCIRTPKTHINP